MKLYGKNSNISMTLVEVLVAMLILSTSVAGVMGSFSYGFKFIKRADAKLDAMNYSRKAQEAYRAIWLASADDSRLANTAGWLRINDTTASITGITPLLTDYVYPNDTDLTQPIWVNISTWTDGKSKQISVKADWTQP